MKKNLYITITAYAIGLILLITILGFLTKLVRIEYVDYTYGGFYAEDEDYDVLLAGSSRMINGVFPMLLWKNHGITSYNYGAHANLIPSTYWVIENALCYKQPKLVVVDVDGLTSDYKYSTPEYLHSWLDSFPMSVTKLKTIYDLDQDLVKDKEISEGVNDPSLKGTKGEYIWDYAKYHSRWDELYETNFNKQLSPEKGAEARIHVTAIEPDRVGNSYVIPQGSALSEEHKGIVYLKKTIESCQNRNIDVLLIYLPCECNESHHIQAATAEKIANQYNVKFLNLLDLPELNSDSDFYDSNHLNPLGAAKITDYLGDYINKTYNIQDYRGDETVSAMWNTDYEKYAQHFNLLFETTDNVENSLLVSSYEDFRTLVEVKDVDVLNEGNVESILNNLKNNPDVEIKIQTDEDNGDFFDAGNYRIRITVKNQVNGEVLIKEY